MKKRVKSGLIIVGITFLIIFIFPHTPLFQPFCKIVMPYPEYFAMYSACGVADAEAPEFKLLNDKLGEIPGNPMITYNDDMVGVLVTYPLSDSLNLLILSLEKTLSTERITFWAQFAEKSTDGLYDYGNPSIKMKIPLAELESIIKNGIPSSVEDQFIKAKESSGWENITFEKAYIPEPEILLQWANPE